MCRILSLLLIAGMSLPFTCMAENEVVQVATLVFEPFISTNAPDGGPATKIVQEAFRLGGLESDILHMPWINAIEQTKEGIYHAIYPAYFSVERMMNFHISEPFLASPVVLIARADSEITTFNGLDHLLPYKIGVVAGYANAEAFDDRQDLTKIVAESDLANLKALKQGTLDLAVCDKLVAMAIIDGHPELLGTAGDYRFLSPPLGDRDMYVMFPHCLDASAYRLERFNHGLAEMRASGRIREIIEACGFR